MTKQTSINEKITSFFDFLKDTTIECSDTIISELGELTDNLSELEDELESELYSDEITEDEDDSLECSEVIELREELSTLREEFDLLKQIVLLMVSQQKDQ